MAEFVKDLRTSKTGATRKLWKVDPPVKYGYDGRGGDAEYVVTSAVSATFTGAETYIFPADEKGEVVDWGELDGSYRGGFDHEKAIAGFEASR